MPLRLIDHSAPPAVALAAGGATRGLARRVGHTTIAPAAPRRTRPSALCSPPGRIQGSDKWRDADVHEALRAALGAPFSGALRPDFEWYFCRGAFFHNDAHYGDVIFGVWCIAGDADLVFPRTALRLAASPGTIAVFDPFEVHGVLARGANEFDGERYGEDDLSVFIGFELELTAAVRAAFGVDAEAAGRTLASGTRISPRDGTFA